MKVLSIQPKYEADGGLGDKKEQVGLQVAVGVYKGKLAEVIKARFYMGRASSASVVYCNVWVGMGPHLSEDGEIVYFAGGASGKGSACGYGYHKMSAALAEALDSAGVKLDKDISGVGETAMQEALTAIARKVGFRGQLRIVRF